ncbi:arabinosyltransferase domain-containing protein [Saccharomonospora sp. NPDC046836]|uniref:arabinosyltransferase domain-containing protein n=1 Tax=Saccharomonospora sp. NPDC046836 TaxID=3156921 RepID=UPI0033ECC802
MPSPRWTIAGLGLLTALSAVLFVLAPVRQDVTTYEWPTAGTAQNTALPLFPYTPEQLDATFGCADAATLGNGLVLSTTPPTAVAGEQPSSGGLTVLAQDGAVTVSLGDETVVDRHPLSTGDCTVTVQSGQGGTMVRIDGDPAAHSRTTPVVNGLFTDLQGQTDLRVSVVPDTRYESSPSALKVALGATAIVSVLAMLLLLSRWESSLTRPVRLLPRGWWRPKGPDIAVTVTLLAWTIIGAATVDDGYIITMIESATDTGFVGNYYRWFNAPESPFSWFYELYRPFADVSGAAWWMRVPSLVLGLLSWLLIDRVLLPRFAKGLARTARWAAAGVFVIWFVTFGIGLRPEPWVVLGTLVVFALVERALATRGLAPLATALVVAGATLTITPTGVAAVIPFVIALPRIVRLLWARGAMSVAVVLGACTSALLFMFYDQSVAAVLHSTEVRTAIGPSFSVLDEGRRYEDLFDFLQGGLNRRLPIMLMWLAMASLIVLLLFKRTPKVAPKPTIRLLAVSTLFFGALAFTPTKYTHHFGALAGLGTLLVAVLVHTIVRGALRRNWERSLFTAVLGVTVWIGLAAPLRWWFLSGLDVKWNLVEPGISNITASEIALVAGLVIAVAGLFGAWRLLRQPGWFVAVVAVGTVAIEVGTMAYAMVPRWDTYTTGRANLASLSGGSCGVEDWLRAEPDISAGLLRADAPARLEGFTVNGGFPDDSRPLAPYGTTAAPVWGSDSAGSLTTGWFTLPEGASAADAPPLVVPAAGAGAVSASVQYAGSDGQVVREERVRLDDEGEWSDARFDPHGATRVRVVATNDGDGWIAVGTPRLPKVVPTTELVPTSERVALDWVDAFALPCRRSAQLADGLTQPVRYRFATGPNLRWLTGMSFLTGPGGPYAPLYQLGTQTPVPTYLEGDKLFEPISVFRLDYPVPLSGVTITHTVR